MGVNRIKTSRTNREESVVVVIDGKKMFFSSTDLTSKFDTASKIKAELEKQAGKALPIFIHKNRDGSIAIATGAVPDVWPEDEKLSDRTI